MHKVYILKSKIRDTIYIGSTSNLERRLSEHNNGRTRSTKRYMPWVVHYVEQFATKSIAIKREKQLKKWKNRKRIEALIHNK
jgi:putative endonuclease